MQLVKAYPNLDAWAGASVLWDEDGRIWQFEARKSPTDFCTRVQWNTERNRVHVYASYGFGLRKGKHNRLWVDDVQQPVDLKMRWKEMLLGPNENLWNGIRVPVMQCVPFKQAWQVLTTDVSQLIEQWEASLFEDPSCAGWEA